MVMKEVYAIRSLKSGLIYIGIAIDSNKRLKDHNRGKSKFTKGYMPWELIYTEKCDDWKSAREKEKYYKTSRGKKELLKKLAP